MIIIIRIDAALIRFASDTVVREMGRVKLVLVEIKKKHFMRAK